MKRLSNSEIRDSILVRVLWDRLISVVDEQAAALVRSSFTPVVSEAEDLAAAVFDPHGEMVAQALRGTPGHIISTANSIRHFLSEYPSDTLEPGDVLITNDPWKTSGHLNDLTVATPVFEENKLIAFFANTCHAADIGGIIGHTEGKDVREEGIYIPITKLYSAGRPNEELFKIIKSNVRAPKQVIGDIRAQVIGNNIGCIELLRFMHECNLKDLAVLTKEILNRSEKAMRSAIRNIPEGTYENEIYADGIEEAIRIKVGVKVKKDKVVIDYSGSSPQSPYGINVVLNYTYAYSIFAIKCVADPDTPNNSGAFRPITVTAPEGCVLNTLFPAPVKARSSLGQLLPSLIFGALAKVIPCRVLAEGYDSDWAVQPYGKEKTFHLIMTGGMGARCTKDGISALAFPARSQAIPIEIVENSSQLLFLRKEIRADSGGAGRCRGGCGQTISFTSRTNEPMMLTISCNKTRFPPKGLFGGKEGSSGEVLLSTGQKPERLKGRMILPPKTIITFCLPGGGGFGDPLEREIEKVLYDVRAGYVSLQKAKEDYGVVIRPEKAEVDWKATKTLREKGKS